jgi:hypothetical protein
MNAVGWIMVVYRDACGPIGNGAMLWLLRLEFGFGGYVPGCDGYDN